MSRVVAFPFLTFDDSVVSTSPWMLSLDGGDAQPASSYLAGWDYASQVRITRKLCIDSQRAAEQLDIPRDELELVLTLNVGTGPGRLPRQVNEIASHHIPTDHAEQLIEHELDGRYLSQRLHLVTSILLLNAPLHYGSLSPIDAGARLWSDRQAIRLEGDEPRFPIEVISFDRMFGGQPPTGALWYLLWSPDELNRDFHGAVRLYLNGDRGDFTDRVLSGDPITIQAMLADVMTQIVESALTITDAEEILSHCEPGSIGQCVLSWIELAYPGKPMSLVRSILELKPGNFRASMLAVAELGGYGE